MYQIDKSIYLVDKNKAKKSLKNIHKKYTIFIDDDDDNDYVCNDCHFRYIKKDTFIEPAKKFILKVLNTYLIHYKRYDPKLIVNKLSYDNLFIKIGLDKKLNRLPKEIKYNIEKLVKDTFDYYLKKFNVNVIHRLSIFIYDIYILLLILTNNNVIFILEKPHIENILFIINNFFIY